MFLDDFILAIVYYSNNLTTQKYITFFTFSTFCFTIIKKLVLINKFEFP